jgi:hypothetical protein
MGAMELQAEVRINAPARVVWTMLGPGFGKICEWAAPIVASFLEGELGAGAVRVCHTARFGPVAGGVIKERLLAFDPQTMSFTYESIAGMPKFIERASNRWSIHAVDGGRCIVRAHATVKLRGPLVLLSFLLKRSFQVASARVLDELRHRIEWGEAHPRKTKSIAANPILIPC